MFRNGISPTTQKNDLVEVIPLYRTSCSGANRLSVNDQGKPPAAERAHRQTEHQRKSLPKNATPMSDTTTTTTTTKKYTILVILP